MINYCLFLIWKLHTVISNGISLTVLLSLDLFATWSAILIMSTSIIDEVINLIADYSVSFWFVITNMHRGIQIGFRYLRAVFWNIPNSDITENMLHYTAIKTIFMHPPLSIFTQVFNYILFVFITIDCCLGMVLPLLPDTTIDLKRHSKTPQ